MTKLAGAFCKVANAPKNQASECSAGKLRVLIYEFCVIYKDTLWRKSEFSVLLWVVHIITTKF